MIELHNKQTTEAMLGLELTDMEYRAYIQRSAIAQIETLRLSKFERRQAEALKQAYLDGGHIEGFKASVRFNQIAPVERIGAVRV